MSELYGVSHIQSIEEMAKSDVIMELYLIYDVLSGNSEQITQFCESTEGQILLEKNAFAKKILTKEEQQKRDFNRRVKLIAYQMCKQMEPALFAKLTKHLKLKKQYANQIMTKYGPRAEKVARAAQKEYIKKMRKEKDN